MGRHQTGTRPPFSPEPLLTVFPEASCSLFPQLFLQGHRRRVGGEGRQRRGHVGCSASMQEFVERGASLAEDPVCAGAAEPWNSVKMWTLRLTEKEGLHMYTPRFSPKS